MKSKLQPVLRTTDIACRGKYFLKTGAIDRNIWHCEQSCFPSFAHWMLRTLVQFELLIEKRNLFPEQNIFI